MCQKIPPGRRSLVSTSLSSPWRFSTIHLSAAATVLNRLLKITSPIRISTIFFSFFLLLFVSVYCTTIAVAMSSLLFGLSSLPSCPTCLSSSPLACGCFFGFDCLFLSCHLSYLSFIVSLLYPYRAIGVPMCQRSAIFPKSFVVLELSQFGVLARFSTCRQFVG